MRTVVAGSLSTPTTLHREYSLPSLDALREQWASERGDAGRAATPSETG